MIYYGFDLDEFDGLNVIYQKLYSLEKLIKDALVPELSNSMLCRWIDTVSDEDRLKGFKILCSVFEV